jgi:hypothetical protein
VCQLPGSPPPGVDLAKLIFDSGLAAAAVSALQVRASFPCKLPLLADSLRPCAVQAFELQGASRSAEASPGGIVCAIHVFASLNLTAPGAEPIIQLLREIPSALRFVLDHPLDHMKAIGMTSASQCTVRPVGDLFTTLHEATETHNI